MMISPFRMTAFTAISALVLLSCMNTILPTHGKSISTSSIFSPQVQEKLKAIRQLSIDAGLPQTNLDDDVCYTDGCLDAAFDILTAMNGSVNPCEDFYQFTCGRWITSHPVPPSDFSYSRFNELIDRVTKIITEILSENEEENELVPLKQSKQFFKQCMDLDGIEEKGLDPLKSLIDSIGGWQLLDPDNWKSDSFNWMNAIAEIYRKTSIPAVIGIYVMPHLKRSDEQIIYIDQPFPSAYAFVMPRGILIDRDNNQRLFDAYESYIVEVSQQLGSTQSEEQLRSVAKEMIAFEEKLAKSSESDEDRYDREPLYNPRVLKDYQEETDKVHDTFRIVWGDLLKSFFGPIGINISDEEKLIVYELEYVKNLIGLLAEEEEKGTHTVANYIVWRLVQTAGGHTTKAMRDITFNFMKELYGLTDQDARDVHCANAAGSSVLGMAISTQYLERSFDENAKNEVYAMVDNLMETFGEMVTEATWMKDETKAKAIEKKDAMETMMAYPDWIKNNSYVEDFFKGLELGENYMESRLAATNFANSKSMSVLRDPTDRTTWYYPPSTVNAFHIFWTNTIVFPAGILQPPFFGGNRPKHQNYGGVGMVIGHEVIHGFDKQGAQYDSKGNVENWWDAETKTEYEKRGQCIIDQYNKYCYEFDDGSTRCVNGAFTQGENIGDNGGLRHSFRAYRKYSERNGDELRLPGLEAYSPEQLFFIGYANIWCDSITPTGLLIQLLTDPHSPSDRRVNGAMRNSMDFAQAYNCPVDSDGMNPPEEEKCTIW